mmetsp:Transcript_33053/g.53102  ORF Transcript_33053/g.53102 Transcript_33053/m.53102 type:complete len:200 (+) Transcript_33053:588-1187(+)
MLWMTLWIALSCTLTCVATFCVYILISLRFRATCAKLDAVVAAASCDLPSLSSEMEYSSSVVICPSFESSFSRTVLTSNIFPPPPPRPGSSLHTSMDSSRIEASVSFRMGAAGSIMSSCWSSSGSLVLGGQGSERQSPYWCFSSVARVPIGVVVVGWSSVDDGWFTTTGVDVGGWRKTLRMTSLMAGSFSEPLLKSSGL